MVTRCELQALEGHRLAMHWCASRRRHHCLFRQLKLGRLDHFARLRYHPSERYTQGRLLKIAHRGLHRLGTVRERGPDSVLVFMPSVQWPIYMHAYIWRMSTAAMGRTRR